MRFILLGLLFLAGVAQGQLVNVKTVNLSTNYVPVSYTNTTAGTTLEIQRQNQVSFYFTARGVTNNGALGIGTGTLVLQLDVSPDDSTYFPNSTYRYTLTLDGTNTVKYFVPIDTSAFAYMRVSSLENTSTNAVWTNIVVSGLFK